MEQKENRVVLRGTVAGEAVLSHQVHGIDFYRFPLAVPRLSGREDLLNILFPLSSPETALPQAGAFVEVTGEIRSFNNRSGVGNRLVITVLARSVVPGEGDPCNQVFLHGVLCKPPVLRRTPPGSGYLRPAPGGQPPLPSGRLSPLHRLGQPGSAVQPASDRGCPLAGRTAAEPHLPQNHRGDHPGAHRV